LRTTDLIAEDLALLRLPPAFRDEGIRAALTLREPAARPDALGIGRLRAAPGRVRLCRLAGSAVVAAVGARGGDGRRSEIG
jgi:hypothetical protein